MLFFTENGNVEPQVVLVRCDNGANPVGNEQKDINTTSSNSQVDIGSALAVEPDSSTPDCPLVTVLSSDSEPVSSMTSELSYILVVVLPGSFAQILRWIRLEAVVEWLEPSLLMLKIPGSRKLMGGIFQKFSREWVPGSQ